jgi:hypothetical protein
MWLMVTRPANQGVVAGIYKKKFQRLCFNVAVAEYHVCLALMTGIGSCRGFDIGLISHNPYSSDHPSPIPNEGVTPRESISNGYHSAWVNQFN